jgi:mannose-6-phosphate isomerase-like protein (cupin superfamily)
VEKVNLAEKFALFSDQWSPKIVGAVNDFDVKLAKVQGEFVWHFHEYEDELFLVVKGNLTIKLRDGDVHLHEGEFFVVPKGVEHCPVAAEGEAHILLLEKNSVKHTGNVEHERTVRRFETI